MGNAFNFTGKGEEEPQDQPQKPTLKQRDKANEKSHNEEVEKLLTLSKEDLAHDVSTLMTCYKLVLGANAILIDAAEQGRTLPKHVSVACRTMCHISTVDIRSSYVAKIFGFGKD